MTTEPTEKHREEAREIMYSGFEPKAGSLTLDGKAVRRRIDMIASALSSRDTEIREVLEGLRFRYSGCWCPNRHPGLGETMPHEPACLAARGLWERVQGTVNEEESDVDK